MSIFALKNIIDEKIKKLILLNHKWIELFLFWDCLFYLEWSNW